MSEEFTQTVRDSVGTAAMRAMLPKDMVERFLNEPFNYEELVYLRVLVRERHQLLKG